jgi:hypothetical protein
MRLEGFHHSGTGWHGPHDGSWLHEHPAVAALLLAGVVALVAALLILAAGAKGPSAPEVWPPTAWPYLYGGL